MRVAHFFRDCLCAADNAHADVVVVAQVFAEGRQDELGMVLLGAVVRQMAEVCR